MRDYAGSAELTIGGIPTSRLATAGEVRLPKLSFIVRNWNYGRFIGRTIDSIRAQDYPNFEVVIVDNASTDDSRDVIERHVGDDPRFRVIHSETNRGSLGAGLRGLEHTTGDFVAFIDSDDTLFSNFASAHIQVHLASRHNIAFTSSSTIETGPDGEIFSGSRARNNPKLGEMTEGLSSPDVAPRLRTINDETYTVLSRHTRLLPPIPVAWPWSPSTSNIYRRHMLDMLAPQCDPCVLPKLASDGHYNRLAHLLGGSALIDLPLSTYRIHGNNFAASTPSLASMGGDAGPATKFHAVRAREMIRVLTANAQNFASRIGERRYWNALSTILQLREFRTASDLSEDDQARFTGQQIHNLAIAFGDKKAIRKLAELVPGRMLRAGIAAHYGRNRPSHIRMSVFFNPGRRLRGRIKQLIRKRRENKQSFGFHWNGR